MRMMIAVYAEQTEVKMELPSVTGVGAWSKSSIRRVGLYIYIFFKLEI